MEQGVDMDERSCREKHSDLFHTIKKIIERYEDQQKSIKVWMDAAKDMSAWPNYNIDVDGTTRPANQDTWDIGAYQYSAAEAPTGAHITVGTSSIAAGGTAYIQVAE